MGLALLDGVAVLDVGGDSLACALAGRVLATLGADVELVELSPDGGSVRGLAPDGVPHTWTRRGTRCTRIDADAPAGAAALAEMAAAADLVLLSDPAAPWRGRAGTLVVTPFGAEGPWRGWRASGPALFHAGGPGSVTPRAPHQGTGDVVAPLAPYGYVPEYYGGLQVAASALACLCADAPVVLDVSLQHCLLPLMRRELAAWWYDDYVASRQERLWRVAPSGLYEALDGPVYVNVIEDRQWRALCALMEREDLLDDTRFATATSRFEHAAALDAALAPWLRARSRMEVFERCGAAGVPVGPVLAPSDLAATDQARARGIFSPRDGLPGLPLRIVEAPA